MRRSRLLRAAATVSPAAYRCLLHALRQCDVAYAQVFPERPSGQLPCSSAASAFSPLFTTKFDFHQHQLTTLGDALIDRYLSQALLQFCTRRGAVLTTNAAAQMNAVLHNHFTLRLFAKELQFDVMALSPETAGDDDEQPLAFLEPERAAPRARDVAGTSHQVALLPCGQSALGWKFSQFVGAVHQAFGDDAAVRVLERVYQLCGEANLPRRASQVLLRVLDHFPATSVAEAVLAAQGLAPHFTSKSRVLPEDRSEGGDAGQEPSRGASAQATRSGDGNGDSTELSIVAGFSAARSAAADTTLDTLSTAAGAPHSLASGPGLVDSVDMWRRRTEELVRRHLEPPPAPSMSAAASTTGWLSAREQATYERGPAFAGWVDFAATSTYADVYGPTQPENGRIVRRTKFKKQARDPRFYDKLSDARNGVPFDTNGETLSDYLDAFSRPHRRLFEVTMLAGSNGEMKLVGRAIATRYTSARESAARAFLGGVLSDVLSLGGVDGRPGEAGTWAS